MKSWKLFSENDKGPSGVLCGFLKVWKFFLETLVQRTDTDYGDVGNDVKATDQ
jgi:hypothetical protein